MSARAVCWVMLAVLAALQYRLWLGHNGIPQLHQFEASIAQMQKENERIAADNAVLRAEVLDLRTGLHTIEAEARSQLGMIRADETFYFLPDRK